MWTRGPGEAAAIHAAPIADLLPTARRPDPGPATPDRAFFPETGHALAFGFKGFWERSGGLPVFGFPLTEEFQQRNPDTGRVHSVQYLERQRFEYHPDLAGTPYEVLLGRLGAEAAAQRGLLASPPFQPQSAGTPPRADCAFVAATGHHLCGPFRAYWRAQGLELGDAGLSERESLALFGYPISEAFVEPATGRTVQYFERAVFEHHPEFQGTASEVLLTRLGADALARVGW